MSEWKKCETIFSNGEEFEIFCLQCEECALYRNGKCKTLNRIIEAMFDKSKFPFDDLLDHNSRYGGKKCKRRSTELRQRKQKRQTQGQLSFLESEEI